MESNFLSVRSAGVRRLRRVAVILGALVVLILLASVPMACTTTIVPPANLQNPVDVLLVDYGHTPALVLPHGESGSVRYVYGDWDYYALIRTDLLHSVAAVLLPTQAALGREIIDVPPAEARQHFRAAEHVYTIAVEREHARQLAAKLDALFEANIDTKHFNERYGTTFVHHPRSYTYFHNSNHMAARWLRELGCETRGLAFASKWKVAEPYWWLTLPGIFVAVLQGFICSRYQVKKRQ